MLDFYIPKLVIQMISSLSTLTMSLLLKSKVYNTYTKITDILNLQDLDPEQFVFISKTQLN